MTIGERTVVKYGYLTTEKTCCDFLPRVRCSGTNVHGKDIFIAELGEQAPHFATGLEVVGGVMSSSWLRRQVPPGGFVVSASSLSPQQPDARRKRAALGGAEREEVRGIHIVVHREGILVIGDVVKAAA